jgi:mannosyltransferase OCH1-like enzyme
MYKYNLHYLIILIIIIYLIFYLSNYFLSKKIINYENFNNDEIPKIIIQTWKTNNIPMKYKNDILSIKKYNKDYKYIFFSDEDIEVFLKMNYPEYYKTYINLPVVIQKIDFFRYIAVYHYGGFYFDLDMKGYYPLDQILKYDCIFPVDQNITDKQCKNSRYTKYCKQNMRILLGQYAFAAKPHNEFIKLLIDTIHNNIDNYIKEYEKIKNIKSKTIQHQYIYSSTGPDYVTDIYLKYNNKKDIHILHYPQSQFFGKYAKHNYYGTWK